MSESKKTVTIISSALNEELCLPEFFRRLDEIFAAEENYQFEIIIFDNGSSDRSWEIIQKRVETSSTTRGIKFSRTFSLDAAFTCGLDLASSDVVVVMASDLQDPPEIIPQMLRRYEVGALQVLVKVRSRNSVPVIRRKLSLLYYKLANKLSDGHLPEKVSDFRLLDKKVYSEIRKLREQHRYFRGLSVWVGYPLDFVEIDRPSRFAGKSSWLSTRFTKVVSVALRNIFSFTSKPLSFIFGFGIFASALSTLILTVYGAYLFFQGQPPFNGFGTLLAAMIISFSINTLLLGILAEYLGLIFDEVKQRPLYLIERDSKDVEG